IILASCDKEIKTTNDNQPSVATEEKPSKEISGQSTQEVIKTTDKDENANEVTPESTDNATPSPTSSIEEPSGPIILLNPPSEYYIADSIAEKKSKSIDIKLLQSTENSIIDEEEWFLNNNLNLNTLYIENAFLKGEGNLPQEIDKTWGDLFITAAFFDESYLYTIYGADYSEGYLLNIYDVYTNSKLYSLDLTNYRYSPNYISEDYDFVQQKINWAVLEGNILYVSNSHRTYAKSSNYMNGFITAIDLTTNSIIWRTKSLVSNASNFQILDDVILCGYGFTAEDDFLYEIDKYTGEVLKEIPLKSAPSYIIKKDNVLYVRTYDTDYEFIIEE
ncbi:MAG: hypothetical protein K0S61_4476, partial [Anaerocolumna sp.]|nr:hypothetical protein [Anaerocolumna sp.]